MKKRILSVMTVLCILFSLGVTVPVRADQGNLITNGDFTDDCADWTNAANGEIFDGTISNNAAYIHGDGNAITNKVTKGGSDAGTLRRFVPVEGGKTYYLSFYAYNTGAAISGTECMSAFVPVKGKVFGSFNGVQFKDYVEYGGQNSWSNESQSEVKRDRIDMPYDSGMNHKEFLITVPSDADYILISIFAWTPVGRLYFSDFELYETDGSTPTKKENVIRLNPADASPFNNGEFQGWGTSLCWWANRIGADDDMTEQAAKLFFSDEGLSLDIARFNIGGGDDPEHKHITRSDSNMPGYATGFDEDGNIVYDWTADANQRNVALAALQANPDLYVAGFSNSPPYFMTNSGCSSGAADANSNNLKDDQYENFAKYLADVTKYLKENDGIDIRCMDPMNEPDTNYWGMNSNKQEGCHFDAGDSQSKILVATRNALDDAGLDGVSVVGTDETSIDKAVANYNKLTAEAQEAVDRIDTHTYGGSQRAQLKQTAAAAGKNLWMSEVDGNWDMFGIADRIITDMNGMQPTAWIIWNIVDRHRDINSNAYSVGSSGTLYEKNMPFDPDGAIYGVGLGNWDTKKIELMQKYYGFGQFTRYIKPGMTIIGSAANTLAAYDKKSGEIVIVALNKENADKEATFDLGAFTSVGTTVHPIRTSGKFADGEQWAELETIPVENRAFTATLKARSVTTYVINDESSDAAVTEFDASSDGLKYKYATPDEMQSCDKYFAVYDADGALRLVTKNNNTFEQTGDFSGCTFKLMIWDDMKPKRSAVTTVAPPPQLTGPIDYMMINGPTEVIAGNQYEYSVTLGSGDASGVTWSVSDDETAEITADGKLTAKKGGSLTITASTPDGKSTTLNITVIGLKK